MFVNVGLAYPPCMLERPFALVRLGTATAFVTLVLAAAACLGDATPDATPTPPPDMAVQVSASGSSACAVRDSGG